MVSGPFEELMVLLREEVSDPKYQEDGYTQNNKPAPQGSIDAALRRTDERMLRESPSLLQYKLRFTGGLLVPDEKEYKKAKME